MEDRKSSRRLIRRATVCDMTGLPVSTLYRYMANGTFPKAVKIGEKSVAWDEHMVNEWIEEKVKNSTAENAQYLSLSDGRDHDPAH